MAVQVAEYLGQRTDIDSPQIHPVAKKSGARCPFMDRACDKVSKGNHPVCSVRKSNGSIWIVCEHRLCSTRQKEKRLAPSKRDPSKQVLRDEPIGLVPHQVDILHKVAKVIYGSLIDPGDIGIRREVSIPISDDDDDKYHADYVMRNFTRGSKVDEVLLEMQGGGETSNTGSITRHLETWSKSNTTNLFLRTPVRADSIETNAWRRQQEQFLVKGNVVNQTGGKLVFAVGKELFNYLRKRFIRANLRDLRKHNWTLCLLAFDEDKTVPKVAGPIPLSVDEERLLFTNYSTFVRFLTDQGGPCPELFEGEFHMLNGSKFTVI
jgi:hypothetical protein